MNRRKFLRSTIASSVVYASGGVLGDANAFPGLNNRVLVNVMLSGGPDFRFLMPPAFDPSPASFSYQYWQSNADAHQIEPTASNFEARWNNNYFHLSDGPLQFGLLDSCGWLRRQWDAGNVAVICNAVGGTSRDHPRCRMQMDHGDLASGDPADRGRSGWGGRLAAVGSGNVLALTKAPRYFCYGPHPTDPLSHDNSNLIVARDMRDITLYQHPTGTGTDRRVVLNRSLESYYAAKQAVIGTDSIYRRFIEHHASLRRFGGPISARLASVNLPSVIDGLTSGALTDRYLGKQFQNLHDCYACSDLIDMRVASLEFGSFDTHIRQKERLESMYTDLFGDNKALDAIYQSVPESVIDNTVFVLAGEFGRQLRSNGRAGTDHGQGTIMLLIGNSVQGGVYGDMFPDAELDRLGDSSPDIVGLTSFEHVFGAACDWVVPGSGDSVFPRRSTAAIESGVSLDNVFVG